MSERSTDFFQVQGLLFARKLVQQFVQHVLDCRRFYAGRGNFHRHAAGPEGFCFESVMRQFVGNFREDGLLRRGQLQHNGHQQALALHLLSSALPQDSFEEHALVRHVLVHNPQAFAVHCHDEARVDLPERLQVRNLLRARQRRGSIRARSRKISRPGRRR